MLKNKSYLVSALLLEAALVLVASPVAAGIYSNISYTPLILTQSVKCVNGSNQVSLLWNNPNSAKSFTLHRNPTTAGAKSWVSLVTTTSLSYIDTKVTTPGTYQYQIQALGGVEASRYSDVVTVTVASCSTTQATTSPTISAVMKCVNGAPQVQLSGTNPNQAAAFTMHRNPSKFNLQSWGLLVPNLAAPSYTDTNVSTGTYQYQMQTIGGLAPTRYTEILKVYVTQCSNTTPVPQQPATTTKPVSLPNVLGTSTTTQPAATSVPKPAVPTTATSATKRLKWGAYSGWSNTDMQEFETKIVKNPDHMAAFVHWGNYNTFPTYMNPFTKDKGRTLVIFWEPSDHAVGGTVQPKFSMDAILAGNWDSYIKLFAIQAKAYGAPVILIPFSEMNGNWNPWSGTTNGNTPEKVVRAYRHVHDVFGDVPNVKFGWAPNSNSVPDTAANAIEKYYPGDAYVDIVGIDGFNFNEPWMTFDQVFNKPLNIISKYNKPIYIFSFASAAGPQKAAWITDALTVQTKKWPLIEGVVWFNQNKESNWLVWSDQASLQAFKEAVK